MFAPIKGSISILKLCHPYISLFFIGLIYLYFSNTSIGFGDALGFVWAAEKGFDFSTNATSHFGYVNLLRLATVLVPWQSAFTIASYFSIVFSVIALFQFYKLTFFLSRNELGSLIAMWVLALSFTWWRQSEIVEVYTFNLAVIGYLLRKCMEGNMSKDAYIISLLLGLSFLVHIKNVLLIPSILFLIYMQTGDVAKTLKSFLLMLTGIFVLMIVPYFSGQNSYQAVFYEDSTILKKAFHPVSFYLVSALKHIFYFVYNFHLWTTLGIYGIYQYGKNNLVNTLFLLSAGVPYFLFSVVFDVPDSYVYSLPFYFIMTLFIGLGINHFVEKTTVKVLPWLCLLGLANLGIYYGAYQLAIRSQKLAAMDESKQYKGGLKYLMWPGMRGNASLLEITRAIRVAEEKPVYFEEMKWNYDMAVDYLAWRGLPK